MVSDGWLGIVTVGDVSMWAAKWRLVEIGEGRWRTRGAMVKSMERWSSSGGSGGEGRWRTRGAMVKSMERWSSSGGSGGEGRWRTRGAMVKSMERWSSSGGSGG
ncbi:hypothetical protein V6N12_046425 [Hibiscus sabdariffa]|uniref:Uncharacterized protein n=1 Tax=Hibiscus sabdariffa TaxID=183260 RepID=A0ABR2DIL2_9ROSI